MDEGKVVEKLSSWDIRLCVKDRLWFIVISYQCCPIELSAIMEMFYSSPWVSEEIGSRTLCE